MPEKIYSLPVQETLHTAWLKTKGTKRTIWAAIGINLITVLIFETLLALLGDYSTGLGLFVGIIYNIVVVLLQMGILYIGIRCAYNLPINWKMVFYAFDLNIGIKGIVLSILEIIIYFFLFAILTAGVMIYRQNTWDMGPTLGPIIFLLGLFIIVYVSLKLLLAIGFVIDKEVTPVQAIKLSFAASKGNAWNLFILLLLQGLILFISVFPLFGLGLIWSLPLGTILFGEIYKTLLVNVNTD